MIHDGLSIVGQNKYRQCFDADPGRGEPKLKSSVADLRSVLTSHKFWTRYGGYAEKNSQRSAAVDCLETVKIDRRMCAMRQT